MNNMMAVAMAGLFLVASIATAQDKAAQDTKKTIGIRVKVFDADRPDRALSPRLAFGYYRPGEAEQPLFLRDLKFEPQDKGFYLVTVPHGILLERLVISVNDPNYNVAVLTKIVTANDMVVYPGASDSMGKFSFQGYKGQLQTYAALYTELVEDLRLIPPEAIRQMFGQQILNMPEPDDRERLNADDVRQRENARLLRRDVLKLYGYLPPELPPSAAPTPTLVVCPRPATVCYQPCTHRRGIFGRRR